MKTSWLDVKRCLKCGSTKTKQGYSDYLDGHTLLEGETLCAKCGECVYFFAYGYSEDYTFTFRELLSNLKV